MKSAQQCYQCGKQGHIAQFCSTNYYENFLIWYVCHLFRSSHTYKQILCWILFLVIDVIVRVISRVTVVNTHVNQYNVFVVKVSVILLEIVQPWMFRCNIRILRPLLKSINLYYIRQNQKYVKSCPWCFSSFM